MAAITTGGHFDPDYDVEVYKAVGTPSKLYDKFNDKFEHGHFKGGNRDVIGLIGHNRFRTQGPVTDEYAHPYSFENVVGCHNGTINAYNLRFLGDYKYEVDSQHLLASLSDHEAVADTWKNVEDNAWSAAALTWWDKRNKSFNIIRNSQRPLSLSVSEDSETVHWASESWMLKAAHTLLEVEPKGPMEIKPHIHYRFTFDSDKGLLVKETPLEKKSYGVGTIPTTNGSSTTKQSTATSGVTKDTHLWLKSFHEGIAIPHAVMVDHKGEEFLCVPFNGGEQNFFPMLDAYFSVYKYSGLALPASAFFKYTIDGKSEERVSPFVVRNLINKEFESILGKGFTMDDVAAYVARVEADREKARQEVKKDHPFAEWVDGAEIRGKQFRRALREAGNTCMSCNETFFPSTPGASGGIFISTTDFCCKSCYDNVVV